MTFENYIEADIHKEYSGDWSLSLSGVISKIAIPNRGDVIEADGEEFRVTNVRKERTENNETLAHIDARHILFDLEGIHITKGKVKPDFEKTYGYTESYELPLVEYDVEDDWVIGYQLKGTIEHHIKQLFEFAPEFSFSTDLTPGQEEKVLTISIREGSVWGALRYILDRFTFGFIPDGKGLIITSREKLLEESSIASFKYAINNINMNRDDNYQDIINTIYATVDLIFQDQAKDMSILEVVGEGYPEYSIDFGEIVVESEEEGRNKLIALANNYLNARSDPVPRYSLEAAELKLIDELKGEQYEYQIGDVVTVDDPDVGTGDYLVVGYEYSLLNAISERMTANVNLGRLPEEKLPTDDREVFEIDNMNYMNTVFNYIQQEFLGGELNRVENDLLNQAEIEEDVAGTDRIPLINVIQILLDISTGDIKNPVISEHDPDDYAAYDPLNRIGRYRRQTLDKCNRYLKEFISITVLGEDLNGIENKGIAVQKLNEAFENVFGERSKAERDRPTAEEVFGEDLNNLELEYADKVLEFAYEIAGNITGIYNMIGGGENGLINSINELYRSFTEWSSREAGRYTQTVLRYLQSKILGGDIDTLEQDLINITEPVELEPARPEFYSPEEIPPDNYKTLFQTCKAIQDILNEEEENYTGDYHIYNPIPKIDSYKYVMPDRVNFYIEEFIKTVVGNNENKLVEFINEVFDNYFEYYETELYEDIEEDNNEIKVTSMEDAPAPVYNMEIEGTEIIEVQEIIIYEERDYDVIEVERGVEGTEAQNWSAGDKIERVHPEKDILGMEDSEEVFEGDISDLYMPYIEDIFTVIEEEIGNPTEIYLNIGGGRKGIIPSINRMFEKSKAVDPERISRELEEINEDVRKITRRDNSRDVIWTIVNYINENIFGGTSKNVNSKLLSHSERVHMNYPSGFLASGGNYRKPLENIAEGLIKFLEEDAETYTGEWKVFDIDAFIDEEVVGGLDLPDMERIIEHYIDTMISDNTFNDPIPPMINEAYEKVYNETGTQNVISPEYLPDYISEKFGNPDTLGMTLKETLARDMIEYAYDNLGNPTEIYMEIGGGRNGVIPAINELMREGRSVKMTTVDEQQEREIRQVNPRIFTSAEAPNPDMGSEGDIWVQVSPEDEEGEE